MDSNFSLIDAPSEARTTPPGGACTSACVDSCLCRALVCVVPLAEPQPEGRLEEVSGSELVTALQLALLFSASSALGSRLNSMEPSMSTW